MAAVPDRAGNQAPHRASHQAWRSARLGDLTPIITDRPDGSVVIRAAQALGAYPVALTSRLAHWARVAPDRTLLAWRGHGNNDGGFERLTYAEAMDAARSLGQALLDRGLSSERPLAILSGNDVRHLLLALAAQHVGVPYAPISPAYSLVSTDFGALKYVLGKLTPGLVFVSDPNRFGPAMQAALDPDVEIVAPAAAGSFSPFSKPTAFEAMRGTTPTKTVEARHAAIDPEAVAKILFTSGSTGAPKGVINTHRMLCSNQQMILQTLPLLGDEPPVLVDWLPWHHTFGGNHNIGIVIYNGGSLYLDEGRPVAGLFDESVRNLREIAPTMYLNVPKGYEELVRAFRCDRALAKKFFDRVQILFYAAASLSQHLADELQALAVEACGERLVLVTGLGSTETAPMAVCRPWPSELPSAIGLPVPGVEAKLARPDENDEKLELRVRGPNVTPGYWREEALTRAAFDDEGFYAMGDAVRPADPRDRSKGFLFDGRIKEDFKLSTGTWVSVGPLRARIVAHFAPYIRDAVVAGENRDELAILAVPDVDACRTVCADLACDAPAAAVLRHPALRDRIACLLASFAARATGSANRIVKAIVLESPPSLDAGEITDKGSLNQRAVLRRRQALVDDLYASPPPEHVIAAAPAAHVR
jgi:feruloyl-CoA synthase